LELLFGIFSGFLALAAETQRERAMLFIATGILALMLVLFVISCVREGANIKRKNRQIDQAQ